MSKWAHSTGVFRAIRFHWVDIKSMPSDWIPVDWQAVSRYAFYTEVWKFSTENPSRMDTLSLKDLNVSVGEGRNISL